MAVRKSIFKSKDFCDPEHSYDYEQWIWQILEMEIIKEESNEITFLLIFCQFFGKNLAWHISSPAYEIHIFKHTRR